MDTEQPPVPTEDPRLTAYREWMARRQAFFHYINEQKFSPAQAMKLGRELGVIVASDQYMRHQGTREMARRVKQSTARFLS